MGGAGIAAVVVAGNCMVLRLACGKACGKPESVKAMTDDGLDGLDGLDG